MQYFIYHNKKVLSQELSTLCTPSNCCFLANSSLHNQPVWIHLQHMPSVLDLWIHLYNIRTVAGKSNTFILYSFYFSVTLNDTIYLVWKHTSYNLFPNTITSLESGIRFHFILLPVSSMFTCKSWFLVLCFIY